MKLLNYIKRHGFRVTLRVAIRRLQKFVAHGAYIPIWALFRLRNLRTIRISPEDRTDPHLKENSLRAILSEKAGGSFLEIGIGEYPHFERLRFMQQQGISYTGCDLASVCRSHENELTVKGFDTQDVQFASNTTGTYSWTLFEMLRGGEQYDVIYVDGHHTFYVDLPAILLADQLLKPGGYLLLDDIEWTLAFLKANFKRSLSQWYFYRKIYKFSEYTNDQQALPHIKMIAEELLLKGNRYTKDDSRSFPHWWALRKNVS
jgi:SAM-dependent methyltransferase